MTWRLRSDEYRGYILAELRRERVAAQAFADACADNNVQALYEAVDLLSCTVDGWRLAFTKVARLQAVSTDIQQAFLPIWIESKMLPLRVGNRRILANGLRLLLPGGYQGAANAISWRLVERATAAAVWVFVDEGPERRIEICRALAAI